MGYAIALLLTRLYFGGLLVCWLNALSVAVFGTTRVPAVGWDEIGRALLLSLVWPLALLSPEGRTKLLLRVNQL